LITSHERTTADILREVRALRRAVDALSKPTLNDRTISAIVKATAASLGAASSAPVKPGGGRES
jgi:hypothetical protein